MRLTLPVTLQTRLGRRIALLFVVSAVLPLAVMTIQGYTQVQAQLMDDSKTQLSHAAKNLGMTVIGQLSAAEVILKDIPQELDPVHGLGRLSSLTASRAQGLFSSLLVTSSSGTQALIGTQERVPGVFSLSSDDSARLAQRQFVLKVDSAEGVWVVAPEGPGRHLWAAVRSDSLFTRQVQRSGLDTTAINVCITSTGSTDQGPDTHSVTLFCPQWVPVADGITEHWDAFLGYDFGAPPWRVMVFEPISEVLAPVSAFRRTFFLSIVTVFGLVVLLSSLQVRRSLQPLEELKAGVERVAERDFSGRVSIASRDEFEDLATSFNWMAGQLDQQFRAITAGSAIDQSALASQRGEEVAATAATQLRDALACDSVNVFVAGERSADAWRHVECDNGTVRVCPEVWPSTEDLLQLREGNLPWIEGRSTVPQWAENPETSTGAGLLLPLTSHDELVGLVSVRRASGLTSEERLVARQLGDQLAVGLANSRLIARLNGLSYGALSALGRTVDANSHWTAGHSERVTALSMRLARTLKLPETDLDTLHRGGLLHDIGKIGVPTAVLEHPGPLDDEQRALIRAHPTVGARILAPISAFSSAVPIVLYHHERVDGKGYPEGLTGGNIPFLARLLAVADVYDALVSDRPYRPGWSQPLAVDTIRALAGTHFDGAMVKAFLSVMATEGDAARFGIDPLARGRE